VTLERHESLLLTKLIFLSRHGKLTTHYHLVPRLGMRGAILTLPQYVFTAWCLIKQWIHFYGVVLSLNLRLPMYRMITNDVSDYINYW